MAEKEAMADDTEEAIRKKEAEAEERRKESHNLVAESIRRELLESASTSYLNCDSADRCHQRRRKLKSPTSMIPMGLTLRASSRHGDYASLPVSSATKKLLLRANSSVKRSSDEEHCLRSSG